MEKSPEGFDALAQAEDAYREMYEQFQIMTADVSYLQEEFERFKKTYGATDPNAQEDYRTLQDEIDALTQHGRIIATAKELDKAEFKTILTQTLAAYKNYEHMLHVAQKSTVSTRQKDTLHTLQAIQAKIQEMEGKMLQYGFDDTPDLE